MRWQSSFWRSGVTPPSTCCSRCVSERAEVRVIRRHRLEEPEDERSFEFVSRVTRDRHGVARATVTRDPAGAMALNDHTGTRDAKLGPSSAGGSFRTKALARRPPPWRSASRF